MKNSTTPKWAKQKNKATRHAARIRMARQWLPTYTGTHLVRAYREKFKVDVTTAINDLAEIGALTPEQADAKRQAEQKRQEHLRRERESKNSSPFMTASRIPTTAFSISPVIPPAAHPTA